MNTDIANFTKFNSVLYNNYKEAHGLNFNGLLKPFTTNPNIFYTPNYQSGVVTGLLGSDLLNPFGSQSTFEGLIWGNSLPRDIEGNATGITQNRLNVRSFGLKNPQTIVGWGYDIFGYPSPNATSGWNASGIYGTSVPNMYFAATPSSISPTGADVTLGMYHAGPMDLRWDVHRKVWTGNHGVYPAWIEGVYNTGVLVTDYTVPRFPADLTYDVRIYDGANSGIVVTGVAPVNARPKPNTYKVYPLATGDFAFIVHKQNVGRPGFSFYSVETPFAEDCTAGSIEEIEEAISAADVVTYAGLLTDPLEYYYGGTGFDTYNDNDILIGIGDGELGKRTLMAGTGITITPTGTDLIIALADTIAYIDNGVNYTITALSGLTTPITINQGGTSATGKIFVDIFSNQTVSGIKNFYSPVRFSNGNASVPSIGFVSGINCGLTHYNYTVGHIASGIRVFDVHPTGLSIYRPCWIKPEEGYYSPLIVQQRTIVGAYIDSGYQYDSTDIQQWRSSAGSILAEVGMSGHVGGIDIRVYNSGRLGYVNLISNTGIVNGLDVYCPTQTGTLALRHEIPSQHTHIWNEIPLGQADGVNDTFTIDYEPNPTNSLMLFRNGLLLSEGVSSDFTLSGTGIVFPVGNIPSTGSKLICSYTI